MFEQVKRWVLGHQYGYEMLFKEQDRRLVGKPGVILAEMGMPEEYEPRFYCNYMMHVFSYVLPPVVRDLVLSDRGIALVDPDQPLAREPFAPRQLVDMHGSFTNRAGVPYVACPVRWQPPGMKRNPWDTGCFLYAGDGKGGAPVVCQKTAAKIVGWYYGRLLPEKKVAWAQQCRRVYEDSAADLRLHWPEVECRHARYTDPDSLQSAVEELLAAGCRTLIYQCFCNPVYSDFEDYAYALPMLHRLVTRRAKVICADQLGNQPAMREAYLDLLRDELQRLAPEASIYLILSRHGHPFKRETLDARGPEYWAPLEAGARDLLAARGGRWELTWAEDEYADPYWNPRRTKLSTLDAYCQAIARGYTYALEVPTDFMAENTDTMILHAARKFVAFADYDPNAPVPYPDWEKPLRRVFHQRQTTGIYLGCPVGPYRRHVVAAVIDSVGSLIGQTTNAVAKERSM